MAAQSFTNLQSKRYGKAGDVTQNFTLLARKIPFQQRFSTGSSLDFPVTLTRCYGFNPGGQTVAAATLAAPQPFKTQFATMTPWINSLSAQVVATDVTRTDGGEVVFADAAALTVEKMKASIGVREDDEIFYGQTQLATVSGVAATTTGDTSGFVTTANGPGGTFVIDTAEWRNGFWYASEGLLFDFYVTTSTASKTNTTATCVVTSVDESTRTIMFSCDTADVTAIDGLTTAAIYYRNTKTGASSYNMMQGIFSALSQTSGSVFGISVGYSGWKGRTLAAGGATLSAAILNEAVANLASIGLQKKLLCLVSSKGMEQLGDQLIGLRQIDYSYNDQKVMVGQAEIGFKGQTRAPVDILMHPGLKHSHAAVLDLDSWMRAGSTEWTFEIPGFDNTPSRVPGTNYCEVFAHVDEGIVSKALSNNILITGLSVA